MADALPVVPKAPALPKPVAYVGGASNGVAMVTPPEVLLPSLTASINKAAAAIPADKTGGLVAILTPKGANAAIVQKVGDNIRVTAWLGKTWAPKAGEPAWDYGASMSVVW
jgi:hypothetical protein